jgi:ABC-2 type transport system permease protein
MNWEQVKTILWLRWQLTRNQWMRSGGLGAVLAVLVGGAGLLLGLLCFVGGLAGGIFGLRTASAMAVMFVWFGVTIAFLLFWMIGLLTELQRSETIDLQRLMHLPVGLGQMFFINYLVSHLALSVIICVPAMLGLAIGLVIARGFEMALLIPLALSMVFMITAWTYCLRGWLAAMMTNPRRRRTIIVGITLAFILVGQAPNLYFNVIQHHDFQNGRRAVTYEEIQARNSAQREQFNHLVAAQKFIPPLWLPVGAQAIAQGRALPALLGIFGCSVIGALGLRRAYRSTVRFYHGETGGMAAARIKPAKPSVDAAAPAKARSRFLELRLPPVPEQAAALALASFRSMLRAPEVKMAWGFPVIMLIVFGIMFFSHAQSNINESVKPFIAASAMVFSVFMFVQFFANQFGFDRDAFRSLMLSPADRRLILLGKNLACLPASATVALLVLGFISIRLHLSPLMILAALFQLATVLLITAMSGNLLSIFVPWRIQPGSMKPTKMSGLATLTLFLRQLLFPVTMSPVFVPPLVGWLWQKAGLPDLIPINLLLSAVLAMAMGVIYWHTLQTFGRWLRHRETKILGAVTAEVE